jgi:predicted nucleotide-binding protein
VYQLDDNEKLTEQSNKRLQEDIVGRIKQGAPGLVSTSPVHIFLLDLDINVAKPPCVFIGHGRSPLWSQVERYLEREANISTINFESEPHAGESIVPILEGMLQQATFAVLILTAEDETASGDKRARQNVIHEAGLFQGLLGFRRAIILRQEGVEEFSNIDGLQYISFVGNNIDQTFRQLGQVLKREKMLPNL